MSVKLLTLMDKCMQIGRIIFEGDDVNPYRLLDLEGACMVEIVDGQYRIERIEDEAHTTEERGAQKGSVP